MKSLVAESHPALQKYIYDSPSIHPIGVNEHTCIVTEHSRLTSSLLLYIWIIVYCVLDLCYNWYVNIKLKKGIIWTRYKKTLWSIILLESLRLMTVKQS